MAVRPIVYQPPGPRGEGSAGERGAHGAGPDHAPAEGTAPANRRRHDRVALGKGVSVYELDPHGSPGRPWDCEGFDLSRSGIGLRSKRMVHPGRRVFVVVPVPGGAAKVLFGNVQYSRYDDLGVYHVGVQFAKPPETAEIKRWMREVGGAAA